MHKPSWFKEKKTLIVNAKTCGINKDGHEQYIVNPETGIRSISDIDDDLAECCDLIKNKNFDRKEIFYTETSKIVQSEVYVPKYFDDKTLKGIKKLVDKKEGLNLKTLGELMKDGEILIFPELLPNTVEASKVLSCGFNF